MLHFCFRQEWQPSFCCCTVGALCLVEVRHQSYLRVLVYVLNWGFGCPARYASDTPRWVVGVCSIIHRQDVTPTSGFQASYDCIKAGCASEKLVQWHSHYQQLCDSAHWTRTSFHLFSISLWKLATGSFSLLYCSVSFFHGRRPTWNIQQKFATKLKRNI